MDKQSAVKLIRETFDKPFDKEQFVRFVKELFNRISLDAFEYYGQYIPDSFRPYISKYERIGKYQGGDDKRIDVLVVYLEKEKLIERARTMQRNFIAGYLAGKYGSTAEKDAALVAFISPNEEDWRFSLVKKGYKLNKTRSGRPKGEEEFTPAKRFSFLVGKNEPNHTAQFQLYPILKDDVNNPTLTQLENAFNIETVTKEFFEKYRNLFLRTKEELDKVVENDSKVRDNFEKNGVDTVNFAKKLLGQIVFLYFLQKKGWFGVGRDDDWGTGSKNFLRELFDKKHGYYKNFFNDVLEHLFYDALRDDRSHNDYYFSQFNCKIPFLNGGLFDPIGNYDWVHTDIIIPDKLFSNTNKTKEGDTGDGILDIFDRYNFTVKEDEPLEKEVAIDPELLGKAYEKFNAIRPDNYDEFKKALKSGKKGEENKFNKKFGVYYTPREIVHYMCQQSLINYLDTELNKGATSYQKLGDTQTDAFGNELKIDQLGLTVENKPNSIVTNEDIEILIKFGEQFRENEAAALEKERNIAEGKQQTTTIKAKLPERIRKHAKLIDDKLANIKVCDPAVGSGAFLVGMMHEIVKTRNILTAFIHPLVSTLDKREIEGGIRTIYNFKRECIEKSLYGVDIDPGAVEIAKLRLWLSLVVDEEDIKRIKPLPNLDYKIVCGNSLLGVEKNLFNNQLFSELERLKPLYFNEANPTKKHEYKKQIDDLITQITNGHTEFDFNVYFSEVFHEKSGFDVVIGNPPYVEHKKLKGISSQLKNFYSTYSGTADLYVYFYEKGVKILRQNGLLVFITSNKFIKTRYGENLRKYFAKHRINEIIDFTDVHVFEALVASCIFSISRSDFTDNKIKIAFTNDSLLNFSGVSEFVDKNSFLMSQKNLSEKIWQLENETNLALKEKIEDGSVTFKEIRTISIYRGVTTGYNPAFIIDEEKRKELIEEDKANEAIIKPLLQGRNIRKWSYVKTNNYLIFTRRGIKIKDYPVIKKQLQKFKRQLEPGVGRKSGSYNWYEIQDNTAYYPEFEKEKIIWGLTADKWAFAYDNDKHYLPSNGYILTSKETPIKYLLALMNSRLMEFYFGFIGIMTAGGAFTLKHETVAEFPIKLIEKNKQQKFITLVDQILAITKDDDYLQGTQKQAQVKVLEREIDRMVYQIYGLTEEEIEIIEGGIYDKK